MVFAIFTPPKFRELLLIIDIECGEHYIFNPTCSVLNKDHIKIGNLLVDQILKCSGKYDRVSQLNSCPYDTKGSGLLSKLLICSYIHNFFNDRKLTDLNLHETCDIISHFLPLYTPNSHNIKTDPRANIVVFKKKSTLKERIASCCILVEELSKSNPNEIMNVIISKCPSVLIKKRVPYLGTNKSKSPLSKENLRSNFNIDMKRTFDNIINDNEIIIRPSISDIRDYFSHENIEFDFNFEALQFAKISDSALVLDEITPSEVINVLKHVDNTSPGCDGISYKDLALLDPEGKLLSLLYNRIIATGQFPESWKSFKTTLIPKPNKNGQYHLISSWRPIALINTSCKVLSSILNTRICQWVEFNNLLHRGQKGGSKFEGCVEHNSILTASLEHCKYTKNCSLSIAWLDIQDAFGSVPHNYIWSLLSHMGMDNSFVNLLKLFYHGSSSFYTCGPILTESIKLRKGVRQGCPMSMILFSIAINPVLESVHSLGIKKFLIGNDAVQILAYADDIALISNNYQDLQILIDQACLTSNQIQMKFRPDKCAYISISPNKQQSVIKIYEEKIKQILNKDFYNYLGVPVGIDNDQSPYETLNQLTADFDKITKSELYAWQKLKAYKIFLHSRLVFPFRTREIKISTIDERCSEKGSKNNNIKIKNNLKTILNLPHYSETSHLYSSVVNGGASFTNLHDEYIIQNIIQMFRLLTTPCEMTLNIMKSSLCSVASTRIKVDSPNFSQALEWINGKKAFKNSKSKKTWWSRPRSAIEFFKSQHDIDLCFQYHENAFILNITSKSRSTDMFTSEKRKELSHYLHSIIFESYAIKWGKSLVSSAIADAIKLCPIVNKSIYRGYIGTFTWNFIHRARTNTLPINARAMNTDKAKRLCRRCHKSEETLSHCLQKCIPNMTLVTERHDKILQKVYDCLLSPDRIVEMNHTCPLVQSSRERVDLIITNVEKRYIYMVDIICPIDTLQNFKNADDLNLAKYDCLKNEIKKSKPDYKVELFTCVFGALGTVPNETRKILISIGISEHYVDNLIKSCAIANMENSAKIWNFHVTNNIIDFKAH